MTLVAPSLHKLGPEQLKHFAKMDRSELLEASAHSSRELSMLEGMPASPGRDKKMEEHQARIAHIQELLQKVQR